MEISGKVETVKSNIDLPLAPRTLAMRQYLIGDIANRAFNGRITRFKEIRNTLLRHLLFIQYVQRRTP